MGRRAFRTRESPRQLWVTEGTVEKHVHSHPDQADAPPKPTMITGRGARSDHISRGAPSLSGSDRPLSQIRLRIAFADRYDFPRNPAAGLAAMSSSKSCSAVAGHQDDRGACCHRGSEALRSIVVVRDRSPLSGAEIYVHQHKIWSQLVDLVEMASVLVEATARRLQCPRRLKQALGRALRNGALSIDDQAA